MLRSVLEAYSLSITQTFYVGVAMSALSLLGAVSLEFKSAHDNMADEMKPHPEGMAGERRLIK